MWVAASGWVRRDDKKILFQSYGREHSHRTLAGKIRIVRQYLRGWAKNTSNQYKKEKKHIFNTLDTLDKTVESTPLDSNEIGLKQYLNNRLAELLKEEMKWYQRAKAKDLLEGDSNTKYFQLVANGKYRKSENFPTVA
jgi:hypothetical protein